MSRLERLVATLALVLFAICSGAQELPDSPKPQQDRPQFPAPNPTTPTRPVPGTDAPPQAQPAPSVQEKAGPAQTGPAPAPKPTVQTTRPGQSTGGATSGADEAGYRLRVETNLVMVPVTVKNPSGGLVAGLTQNNFSIYENGVKQPIRFFTSDPFPLSAAIVLDIGMADVALKKVADTFPSLSGSFSEYDEVSIYTYGNTVKQQQDFIAALNDKVTTALKRSGEIQGRGSGPLVPDSPLTAGPSVNGRPFDPAAPNPTTRTRSNEPSRVLNDAILRAALDLSKRDRARRKVIFVISDGREQGSIASYEDVLKVLLSNEVSVYAIAVDQAAIPIYKQLNKIRLPRQGYGNILPKYANATGGEVFTEFTKEAIDRAYAGVSEQARNQYTLAYTSPQTATRDYRTIEVRVNRPGLLVFARDGYYPLPTTRK